METERSLYDCNICLSTAKNAVICVCGHLYCWPCLHFWMLTPCAKRKTCPVCRSPIDLTKIIPLYGRNSVCVEDGMPDEALPPRPVGQRIAPQPEYGPGLLSFIFGIPVIMDNDGFPYNFMATAFDANYSPALYLIAFIFGTLCLFCDLNI